jgi:hypothetical protein
LSTVFFFDPLQVDIVEVIADIHIPFLRIEGPEDGPLEPLLVFRSLREIDKYGNSVRLTGFFTDERTGRRTISWLIEKTIPISQVSS